MGQAPAIPEPKLPSPAAEVERALRGGARLVAVLCDGAVPPGLARRLAAQAPERFTAVHVPSARLGARGIPAWTLDHLHALTERPGGPAVAEPAEALLELARARGAEGGAVALYLEALEPLAPETAAWLADALIGARSGLRLIALGSDTPAFRAICRGLDERPAWVQARGTAPAGSAAPPWERPRAGARRRGGRSRAADLLAAAGLAALLLALPWLGLIEPLDLVPTDWGVPARSERADAPPEARAERPLPPPLSVREPGVGAGGAAALAPSVDSGPPSPAQRDEPAAPEPTSAPGVAREPSPPPVAKPPSEPGPGASPPASASPRPSPPDIVRVAPPEPGALVVNAIPPARIAVDGVEVGVTPIVRLPVSRGPHQVVATFADGRRVARDVEVGDEVVYLVFP